MADKKIEEELDIKAIDSFFIVIKRNSSRLLESRSSICNENCQHSTLLEKQCIPESPPTDYPTAPPNHPSQESSQSSKANKKRSQIMENIQKCEQMRLKYEHLLRNSPNRVRPSSSGRLQKQMSLKKDEVKYLDYAEKSKKLRETKSKPLFSISPREKQKYDNLYPHIRIQPYLLSIYSKDSCLNLYLLKPIRKNPKYNLFLSQQLNSKLIFTLKMLKKQSLGSNDVTKLIKEVKIQAFFSHPNIVRLYHVLCDKNFIYVLYEPSMHYDLATILKQNGPLAEKELRGVVRQIGSALEYMHRLDILHLKLRLQNVYMQEEVVKIAVFQDSVHLPLMRNERMPSIHLGINEKLGIYDTKMDIWDVGILTYQLMFGKLPVFIHQHEPKEKGLLPKKTGTIYFPEDTECSQSFKDFIEGCLQQNPYKRFSLRQMNQHPFLRGGDAYRWTMM